MPTSKKLFDPKLVRDSYRRELERTIARKVQQIRWTQHRSQEDVAQALGLHRPAVSAIERGERKLGAAELVILADLFGVAVQELLP